MGRPPPRERAPLPAKSSRRGKVAAPAVVSFKSMAKCMAEAMLRCQEFKQAKKPNGQGVNLPQRKRLGERKNVACEAKRENRINWQNYLQKEQLE